MIKINGNQLKMEVKAKEKIIMTYYFKTEQEKEYYLKNLELGDEIHSYGKLVQPSSKCNFLSFNYQNYLKSKKIYWLFSIEKFQINKKDNIFYKIKKKMLKRIENSHNQKYLKTLILGENDLEENVKDTYRLNGTSHLFSISGMHITLLTTSLLFILNKVSKKKWIHFIIISIILIFYIFLTNYSPSVIRAALLFIFLNIKKVCSLQISNFEILLFLFLFLLSYNPYYVYNVGFLYSFIISLGLIYFSNQFCNESYLKRIFHISLIAFLLSIPITIKNFYEINLLSPLINILFVPLMSFVIFPFTIFTFLFPILNPIYTILIQILEVLSFLCSKVAIVIILKDISFFIILLYYIVIIWLIQHLTVRNVVLLIFLLLFHSNLCYLDKSMFITTLDVGQGDSIVVKFPQNQSNILIDTGGIVSFETQNWKMRNSYSISKSITIPYLKSIGIHKLNYLIITHGDYDHMGEAINLVNNFKVEKVIFNCGSYNDLEKELIKVLDKKKIKYYSCIKELNIDKNKLHFLQTKEYDNENDNSNVIYTELNGYKFMFMGDAGVDKEKDILDKYNISDIDVLKVGHHGSKTSSGKEFIEEINPKYSIISVGKNNRYGHPNKEALNNLENSKIYRTDQEGSIIFKIKNNKLKIETCSPQKGVRHELLQ